MSTVPHDRNDRYRHLRANLAQHRVAQSFRTVKQWCVVCQLFEPDDSGRCPLCQPTSGDVVADLLAERAPAPPRPRSSTAASRTPACSAGPTGATARPECGLTAVGTTSGAVPGGR